MIQYFCAFFCTSVIVTHFVVASTDSAMSAALVSSISRRDSRLAAMHFSRALREVRCKDPAPRVVHVSEVYANSGKKYLPHCTVLYKCSQDTGCCHSEDQVCGPKTVEIVKLPFWTVELTLEGQRKGVEMLDMENHTECECKPISRTQVSNPMTKYSVKHGSIALQLPDERDNRIGDHVKHHLASHSSTTPKDDPINLQVGQQLHRSNRYHRNRLQSFSDLLSRTQSLFLPSLSF